MKTLSGLTESGDCSAIPWACEIARALVSETIDIVTRMVTRLVQHRDFTDVAAGTRYRVVIDDSQSSTQASVAAS